MRISPPPLFFFPHRCGDRRARPPGVPSKEPNSGLARRQRAKTHGVGAALVRLSGVYSLFWVQSRYFFFSFFFFGSFTRFSAWRRVAGQGDVSSFPWGAGRAWQSPGSFVTMAFAS